MDMRAEVYSPLQNATVWLAAWLHGHESADDLIDAWRDLGFTTPASLMAEVREKAEGAHGPQVRLLLSGPGEASGIPGGHREGIVIADRHVLVPEWEWVEADTLPAPAWLSPGEADQLLTQATDEAADLIEASGYRTDALHNPRLTVGTLSDFYDTPGLPGSVPPRAAKLFARADRVAAIIETVISRMGDHSLDSQLFSLWRHIRTARMAGVTYCAGEYSR
ncbi:hypothetical protein C3B44_05535 [Corynebacterium yudongzhengii]|uniref:Uncharacterized protein n=1 Tax=Corynebacterium yudongzhengii TaxID=2080740 RepID=A0A2U1T8E4_9CORY|nr:hypothetical protein [Corynebacterium yudongzhengii]AWB81882.1 hypothetical protein C3B44_05535 [Corynebacterium yudongzhengii]PWC02274.1 hypothetical protein DF222_02755 [Corynebacterium yudongzhengii]